MLYGYETKNAKLNNNKVKDNVQKIFETIQGLQLLESWLTYESWLNHGTKAANDINCKVKTLSIKSDLLKETLFYLAVTRIRKQTRKVQW